MEFVWPGFSNLSKKIKGLENEYNGVKKSFELRQIYQLIRYCARECICFGDVIWKFFFSTDASKYVYIS